MKCKNCGFESENDFAFCTQCGVAVESMGAEQELVASESTPINPLREKTFAALKDPLFLVLCILITVGAALSLFADGLPLLNILAAIFLWITYAKVRRDDLHVDGLRCISGIVYADYIISYVVTGLLVVMGVLLAVIIGVVAGSTTVFNEIVEGLGVMDAEYMDLIEILLSASAPLMFLVFLLVAVPVFLFNFFGTRKIHGFVKSLYQGLQSGTAAMRYTKEAKTWLMILGIFSAISGIASLPSACSGAAMILASVLVGRHFNNE